jgi:hypothetical protein
MALPFIRDLMAAHTHRKSGDVLDLAQILTVEFNVEGHPLRFVEIVCQVRPTLYITDAIARVS